MMKSFILALICFYYKLTIFINNFIQFFAFVLCYHIHFGVILVTQRDFVYCELHTVNE